jgi:hypothetical protein
MTKILLIMVLLHFSTSKLVYKIIRKQHNLELGFEGQDFIRLTDIQFKKFDTSLDVYQESVKECIKNYMPKPEYCEHRCLGENLSRFTEGLDMVEYKNFAIFQHMIDVAFNENCLDADENRFTCLRMMKDSKYLLTNSFDVIETFRVNKGKYINSTFEESQYDRIINILMYLFDEYEKYEKQMTLRRQVMQGEIWVFFQTTKETFIESQKPNSVTNEDGSENLSAVSLEIIRRIGELYPLEHDKYRKYIDIMKLPNPFEYEDNLALEELRLIREDTLRSHILNLQSITHFDNLDGRKSQKIQAPVKTMEDVEKECSEEEDIEFCIEGKIKEYGIEVEASTEAEATPDEDLSKKLI